MTRIIIIRHGESKGNFDKRFYGHTDGPLTDLGRSQAKMAGEFLRDFNIDIAYSSDLKRAYETAKLALTYHPELKIIPDEKLREIFAGDWENQEFDRLVNDYADDYDVWRNDISNCRATNGESFSELSDRINSEIWKITKENEGKTVFVATHATPIRTLISKWLNYNAEQIAKCGWVKNASITIADYDTDKNIVEVIKIGDVSFLGDLQTALPSNV